MNRIDLTNLGGFPLEQDTLKFMQDSYDDVQASVAALFGDKAILSGVQVVGGNVTNGWITYQGEILKFVGGAAGADVVIVETTQDAVFEDGATRPVYKTRYATIGTPGTFPFTDLKPANVGVPVGTVVMWSGSVNAIPAGWQLHAPLAGKFIVGYDPADVDYDAIGKIGGEKKHQLTNGELPKTQLRVNTTGNQSGVDPGRGLQRSSTNGDGYASNGTGSGTYPYIESFGNDEAHENRPPYYVLAYIIKL